MPRKFTKISSKAFEEMQLDAGVLLKTFTPDSPAEPGDSDIICATTGGIQISCVPTYSDMGEDVDNCPTGTKELKHLDGWECKFSFNALSITENVLLMALGAAKADSSTHKVTPAGTLEQSHFTDNVWWVGDKGGGGLAAVKLSNVLSSGGFSLQTTKNGKGQLSVELQGHVSISDTTAVPMEFYATESEG